MWAGLNSQQQTEQGDRDKSELLGQNLSISSSTMGEDQVGDDGAHCNCVAGREIPNLPLCDWVDPNTSDHIHPYETVELGQEENGVSYFYNTSN